MYTTAHTHAHVCLCACQFAHSYRPLRDGDSTSLAGSTLAGAWGCSGDVGGRGDAGEPRGEVEADFWGRASWVAAETGSSTGLVLAGLYLAYEYTREPKMLMLMPMKLVMEKM